MRIDGTGKVVSSPLEMGKVASLGPYHCCWEQSQRLHFYFCAPGGREIAHTTVFLDALDDEKPTRQAFVADDPVIWLHGYMDHLAGLAEEPAFEHNTPEADKDRIRDAPPHKMLWIVGRRGNAALVCTRANLTHQRGRAEATFETERADQWRVAGSVVTAGAHLGLLLASPDGRPYYASTRSGKIQPVADIAKREITFAQQPSLVAGTQLAPLPWVYLRYMDPEAKRNNHVLLEPEGEKDPEYHGHSH
jgi:hypothetical protein